MQQNVLSFTPDNRGVEFSNETHGERQGREDEAKFFVSEEGVKKDNPKYHLNEKNIVAWFLNEFPNEMQSGDEREEMRAENHGESLRQVPVERMRAVKRGHALEDVPFEELPRNERELSVVQRV